MGAWIEITTVIVFPVSAVVAPFVGAWIEIPVQLPKHTTGAVAPFVGAWIEIAISQYVPDWNKRRSLRGSVD